MGHALRPVITLLFAFGWGVSAPADGAPLAPVIAPELEGAGLAWINTESPISLAELRGKKRVVLWFSTVF